MAKNVFITDFISGNYVKCPKSKKPIRIDIQCHHCEWFMGGGVRDYKDKSIAGNCYVNCAACDNDTNVQMELINCNAGN